MGDLSSAGGMWPEQASFEDLAAAFDNGIPAPPAGGATFIPLQVRPGPVGNPDADALNTDERSPALFTIKFLQQGRYFERKVQFRAGLSLQHYLREARLIGARKRYTLIVNRKLVRMTYVPKEGEYLALTDPVRPFIEPRSPG